MTAVRRLSILRRVGDCNKCGACCVGNPYTGEGEGPCPHLRPQPDGRALCEIHGQPDTYWAQGCNVWPSKPEHVRQPHMIGKCSFAFVEAE